MTLRKPWTGKIKGENIPWGHHKIMFDGREVLLDERGFSRFNTWECGYGDDDSSGVHIDDLLAMLPGVLRELRIEGWKIVPPGSHAPAEEEFRDTE